MRSGRPETDGAVSDKLPLIELFFSLSILALAIWELYRTPNPNREERRSSPQGRSPDESADRD